MITAEIIADSLSPFGHRMTSTLDVFPRIILAEMNTHKMLSKNSASSRAIKYSKMVEAVRNTPFVPIKFMKDHSGMQGTEYLDESDSYWAKQCWLVMRDKAIEQTNMMHERYNVTKQMLNRWLEAAAWTKDLISGTEWENFFALRTESGAEIHMQATANAILEAMNASTPKRLKEGEWHIPFNDSIDPDALEQSFDNVRIKIATAKCAQTSYTVIHDEDQGENYEKDIRLHDRLIKNGHMSPFEHIARVMTEAEYYAFKKVIFLSEKEFEIYQGSNDKDTYEFVWFDDNEPGTDVLVTEFGWCHNLRGFRSYRSMIPNENRKFSGLIKHTY